MRRKPSVKSMVVPILIGYVFVLWAAILAAPAFAEEGNLFEIFSRLTPLLNEPFQMHFLENTPKTILYASCLYAFALLMMFTSQRNTRYGEEHGSAAWGDVSELCHEYSDKKHPESNRLFTQNFALSMDMYETDKNLHSLIIGGPGTGKSRYYVKPNIMQCNSSYIITDPKGELLRATGWLLSKKGYEIRVFDLVSPKKSHCYNPFFYIQEEKDVLTLISNLISNTTPKGARSNDPFWDKAETALLQALMLYLIEEAPLHEQNFSMVLEMIRFMKTKDEEETSPVDVLFEQLSYKNPESLAVQQYAIFKQAAPKTAQSILVSTGVRLASLNIAQYKRMISKDDMDLGSIGERKVALFCITPVNDKSMNFLISMLYTQAFQVLMNVTAEKNDGRLPVHVHCIMDEFANIALPDDFESILSTTRSYEISFSIIIQSLSQLKEMFDKKWEAIVADCDELLYLGGNEASTFKFISELLDKETLDTNSYGRTRGRNGSYSTNYQNAGRDLMTPGEVRMLSNKKALLFLRNEQPIIDFKYSLKNHSNIKHTSDGGNQKFRYETDLARPRYTCPDTCELLTGDEALELVAEAQSKMAA